MSLAERNWNYNLERGNLGVTGNFFQKFTKITSDHNYKPSDGLMAVDTTAGEVVITLPSILSWPKANNRIIIPIIHIAGRNNVKVKLSGSEKFNIGNSYFNLGTSVGDFDFYAISSVDYTLYGILTQIKIKGALEMTDNWASANFEASTVIPFNAELNNNQDELLHVQTASSGVIAEILSDISGELIINDVAHGLVVGDYIIVEATSAYNGDYFVKEVPSDDSFIIEGTFDADESGTWRRPPHIRVLNDGTYSVSFLVVLDSTGGASWDCTAAIHKVDTLLPETLVNSNGLTTENATLSLSSIELELFADDYIDLRLNHTTFTGVMTGAQLKVEFVA